ncbi:DUF2087 domain-containing protein [Lacticaseibacillus kribbianus]|uniref:DUF2087 domain-containing protein n=1 Tax=Lacticaseibacillus kribbianus TaxID=2926292 RepID=UPI001CD1B538|nr:DUF2087 domain-containing protein [Lacticaseibacillus kribbianus]
MTNTIEDWRRGFHRERRTLACNYCDAHEPLTTAGERALTAHIEAAHGGALAAVLAAPDRANALTPTQQTLLTAFAEGASDRDVAAQLGLAAGTVRHQKFTFRQKAAQARLYLAQFTAAFGADAGESSLVAVPAAAAALGITEADYAAVIAKHARFGDSLTIAWPRAEKARVCLCLRLCEEFTPGQHYSGPAVRAVLVAANPDYAILARYLVDYGFLARTPDGRDYWRIFTNE